MSTRLLREAMVIEQSPELHMARLLILINAKTGKKGVDGIMKLAKLDFLLRYPLCLEKALTYNQVDPEIVHTQEHEKTSIESKMIRFKYGPWDGRYRQWLGLLVARGLVHTELDGRTVRITLTEAGKITAGQLAEREEFKDLVQRSSIIQKQFGPMTSTKIKDFVYQVFPELKDMRWGEEINT